jgi:hypothetical protein
MITHARTLMASQIKARMVIRRNFFFSNIIIKKKILLLASQLY